MGKLSFATIHFGRLAARFWLSTGCYYLAQGHGDAAALGLSATAEATMNTLSGVLAGTINESVEKLKEIGVDDLNGDLQHAMVAAFAESFRFIKDELIRDLAIEVPGIGERLLSGAIGRPLAGYEKLEDLEVKVLDPIFELLISDEQMQLFVNAHAFLDPGSFMHDLVMYVNPEFGSAKIGEVDGADYIQSRFVPQYTHHFRQQLKSNDEAKTVYFTIMLESLLSSVGNLADHDQTVYIKIKSLLSQTRLLRRDIAKKFPLLKKQVQQLQRENSIKLDELLLAENKKREPVLTNYVNTNPAELANQYNYKSLYTSFIGRDSELAVLLDFMDAEGAFKWWTMLGVGGSGKSRMAYELIETMRCNGYHAGFYNMRSHPHHWGHWEAKVPTLIVIDYGLSDLQGLSQLITELEMRSVVFDQKVRLLIVEREYTDEWRATISGNTEVSNSAYTDRQFSEAIRLSSFSDDDRWRIVSECLAKGCLSEERRRLLLNKRNALMADLGRIDPQNRPLFALFAGIALAERQDIRQWNANGLLDYHLRRLEQKVWARNAFYLKHKTDFKKLLTLATLSGEIPVDELGQIAKEIGVLPLLEEPGLLDDAFLSITGCRRSEKGEVETYLGLSPDILGEYFVIRSLQELEREDRFQKKYPAESLMAASLLPKNSLVYFVILRTFQDFGFNLVDWLYDWFIRSMGTMEEDEIDEEIVSGIKNFLGQLYLSIGLLSFHYRGIKLDPDTGGLHRDFIDYVFYRKKHFQADYDRIIANFDRAVFFFPEARMLRSRIYKIFQKFDLARADLDMMVEVMPDQPLNYLIRAEVSLMEKRFEQGFEDTRRALELSPFDAGGFLMMGRLALQTGDYALAEENLLKGLYIVQSEDMRYKLGSVYLEMGIPEKTLQMYDQLLLEQPDNHSAIESRALFHFKLRNFEQARLDLERAIEIEPGIAAYHLLLGNIFYSRMDYRHAIAIYSRATFIEPNHPQALLYRGECYLALGKEALALADFELIERLDPGSDTYFKAMGNMAKHTGDFLGARDAYLKQVEIKPDAEGFHGLGKVYEALGEWALAIASFEKAMALSPRVAVYPCAIGDFYYNREKYELALGWYEKAMSLDDHQTYKFNWGRTFRHIGRFQESLDAFIELTIDFPEGHLNWHGLATAYFWLENFDLALLYYQKAISMHRFTAYYFADLANTLMKMSRFEEAIEQWKLASDLTPDYPAYFFNIGNCYVELGNWTESIEWIKHSITLDDCHFDSFYLLGKCYFQLEGYADAIEAFDRGYLINSGEATLLMYRGGCKFYLADYQGAISDIRLAIGLDSQTISYHQELANTFQKIGSYAEAGECLLEISRLSGGSVDHLRNAAFCFYKADDYVQSLECYNRALELVQGDSVLWHGRALVYFFTDKFELAAADFKRAVSLDQRKANYYFNLANTLDKLERYVESLSAYQHAIELASDEPVYHSGLAGCYYHLGMFALAEESFAMAADLAPDQKAYFDDMRNCKIEFLKGNMPEAVEELVRDIADSKYANVPVAVLYNLLGESFADLDEGGMQGFAQEHGELLAQAGVERYNEKISALAENTLGFCREHYDDPAREATAFKFLMENAMMEVRTEIILEFDVVIQMGNAELIAYIVNSVVDGFFTSFRESLDRSSGDIVAQAQTGVPVDIETYKLMLDDMQTRVVLFLLSF